MEWLAACLDAPIADDLITIGSTTGRRQQMAPLPRVLQHIALVEDGVAHLQPHHGRSHPQWLIVTETCSGAAFLDIEALGLGY